MLGALATQLTIGVTMVTAGPGALVQALHLAGAAALWGSVVALWTAVRSAGSQLVEAPGLGQTSHERAFGEATG